MDTRTLFQLSAIVTGCIFAFLVLIHLATPALRGLRSVCYGFASASAGLWLISLHDHAPAFFTILLGAAFMLLTNVFFYRGLVDLFRLHRYTLWLGILSVLPVFTWNAWFTFVHPAIEPRILSYSLVLSIQNVMLAALVLRNGSPRTRIPRLSMGVLFSLWAAATSFRFCRALLHQESSPFPVIHSLNIMIILVPVLSAIITVIAFLWLAMAKLQYSLELQANVDALTGLPDRRALEITGAREIARARRAGAALSTVLLNLDNIQAINDKFGHDAGDFSLHIAASCLSEGVRTIDLIARIGGNQFVIFLPETTAAHASEVAHRLHEALQQLTIRYNNREFPLSASFGVTELSDSDLTWQDMLFRAELALQPSSQSAEPILSA